jgi:hypothetical protein
MITEVGRGPLGMHHDCPGNFPIAIDAPISFPDMLLKIPSLFDLTITNINTKEQLTE